VVKLILIRIHGNVTMLLGQQLSCIDD